MERGREGEGNRDPVLTLGGDGPLIDLWAEKGQEHGAGRDMEVDWQGGKGEGNGKGSAACLLNFPN